MKKMMIFLVVVIAAVTVLAGCSGQGYVNRARKYIAEKYNGLEVEHKFVRGNENGFASAGYYYTYWQTLNDPIVEFFVAQSTTNFDPTGEKKGDMYDEYEIVLIELEMKKRAEDYFNQYLDNPYYIEIKCGKAGDYTKLSKDEYIDLEKFLELTTLSFTEITGWKTVLDIFVSYDDAINISADEMYLICQEVSESQVFGYEPGINIGVDKFEFIEDEQGNEIINEDKINMMRSATFPSGRFIHISKEEFISDYTMIIEFVGKSGRSPL